MSEQKPSIGRIVTYRLSANDVAQINRRRERAVDGVWPEGTKAPGNSVSPGDEYPMVVVRVVRVWPSSVNGQVMLDGPDVFWATSVHEGAEDGTWHWPARV